MANGQRRVTGAHRMPHSCTDGRSSTAVGQRRSGSPLPRLPRPARRQHHGIWDSCQRAAETRTCCSGKVFCSGKLQAHHDSIQPKLYIIHVIQTVKNPKYINSCNHEVSTICRMLHDMLPSRRRYSTGRAAAPCKGSPALTASFTNACTTLSAYVVYLHAAAAAAVVVLLMWPRNLCRPCAW